MREPTNANQVTNPVLQGQRPSRPVGRMEFLAIMLLVVLADVTIYRGQGDSGVMAFIVLAPVLLMLGTKTFPRTLTAGFLGGMLILAAMKLIWSGSGLLVGFGILLVVAFAMEASGLKPFVLDVLAFALHLLKAGFLRLDDYFESLKQMKWWIPRRVLVQYGFPLAAVACFGGIFVLANPDVSKLVGEWSARISEFLVENFSRFTPRFSEVLFWLAMAWIFAGLLKPLMKSSILDNFRSPPFEKPSPFEPPIEAALYPAYANTLSAVIVLFLLYLGFEFQTLWLSEFPPGFYYSGYAHQGAAWLTIALALATVLLSVMFRADVLHDDRLPRLRRLAWVWSALNLCLAAAVYHRLLIYVEFNGMTRMRTVGFLGISAVVAGFLLVVRKIAGGQDFVWLIRRQLGVLAFAGFLFAVIPVDALVHRYNVRRILAGDPAPSVQISVHPMDAGGAMELFPLLDSDNAIIREGIRAMLAQRAMELPKILEQRERQGWTSFQWADWTLGRRLENTKSLWSIHEKAEPRHAALKAFQDYAYQWY